MHWRDLDQTGDVEQLFASPEGGVFAVMTQEGNSQIEKVDQNVQEISQSQARESTEYKDEFDRLYTDAIRYVAIEEETDGLIDKLKDLV